MSHSYEINNTIRRIQQGNEDISRSEYKVKGEVSHLSDWWQGSAARAFVEVYNQTSYETQRVQREIDYLKNDLRSLDRAVDRAEEERRREREEARRLRMILK